MMLTVCHCSHPFGDDVLVILYPGACIRLMPCIINRPNTARAGTVMWRHMAIALGVRLRNEGAKGERGGGGMFWLDNKVVLSESVINDASPSYFLVYKNKNKIVWCHVCQFCWRGVYWQPLTYKIKSPHKANTFWAGVCNVSICGRTHCIIHINPFGKRREKTHTLSHTHTQTRDWSWQGETQCLWERCGGSHHVREKMCASLTTMWLPVRRWYTCARADAMSTPPRSPFTVSDHERVRISRGWAITTGWPSHGMHVANKRSTNLIAVVVMFVV